MISSEQRESNTFRQIFPILSLKKFAFLIGIPIDRLKRLSESVEYYYSPFPKETNGKTRLIDRPTSTLKTVQSRMNARILRHVPFPTYIIGGVKGKKPLDHPKQHIRKQVVVTIDAKDCFPSITNKRVFDIWHKQLKCSPEVSRLATKLTTRNGHLPLGAPTSNYLANLALLPCVEKVAQFANQYGFIATQYIDDIAFSGQQLPDGFITSILKEFSKNGIKIHRKKIRVMRANTSQRITGKTVNKKVAVPLEKRNRIRAALNELRKIDSSDPAYEKRFRSVKSRIYNLKHLHPTKTTKMIKEFGKLKKPRNVGR